MRVVGTWELKEASNIPIWGEISDLDAVLGVVSNRRTAQNRGDARPVTDDAARDLIADMRRDHRLYSL
jgi:hypothetical protein